MRIPVSWLAEYADLPAGRRDRVRDVCQLGKHVEDLARGELRNG